MSETTKKIRKTDYRTVHAATLSKGSVVLHHRKNDKQAGNISWNTTHTDGIPSVDFPESVESLYIYGGDMSRLVLGVDMVAISTGGHLSATPAISERVPGFSVCLVNKCDHNGIVFKCVDYIYNSFALFNKATPPSEETPSSEVVHSHEV